MNSAISITTDRLRFIMLCCLGALCLCGRAGDAGAFSTGSTQPVSIDADSLEVRQKERLALFKGHVVAIQGDMRLNADAMHVYYGDSPAENPSSLGSLRRIDALGNVSLKTMEESATATKAVYEAQKEKIFLYGKVVLQRGGNVLHGSRLEYDLITGASMLTGEGSAEVPASSSRVRGLFVPQPKEKAQ